MYDSYCKYKNCKKVWLGDGYCLKHLPIIVKRQGQNRD